MPNRDLTAPGRPAARAPLLSYNPFLIGLRYLRSKVVAYLAIILIAYFVGQIIVVMSVFTGFHLQLTRAIRGYLSDLTIRPMGGRLYGLEDWESWVERVRAVPHVDGVAPCVEGFGLVRLPRTDTMFHVFFRGVHPELEPDVSQLSDYMRVGELADLTKTYADPAKPESGGLKACFVGKRFPGFIPEFQLFDPGTLDRQPGRLILITATADLDRRLAMYAVSGLFETTYYDYDSKFVIMGLETAMEFVGSRGAVSGLNLKLDDYENAREVRQALADVLKPGATLRTFDGDPSPVERVALSADASRLAALAEGGEVLIWDTATGALLRTVSPGQRTPTAIALDSDGQLLIAGHEEGAALLDVGSQKEVLRLPTGGSAVTAACFSPDGFTVALGCRSGEGSVFDTESGELLAVLKGHGGPIADVAFDPYGQKLLTTSADGTACIWDAETGRKLTALTVPDGPPLTAGVFSPDGARVIIGDEAGRVIIWDAETGRALGGWHAHDGGVRAVAFGGRPGGVVTCGSAEMRLWVTETLDDSMAAGLYSVIPQDDAPLRDVAFGANGKRLVSVGASGRPRLRYCGPGFSITTWEDEQRTMLEAVAMERFLQAMILGLILVAAELTIFIIVSTMVNERRRDIGIMKAIGFTSGQVCIVFLFVGLAIGTIGALLGVGGGLLFSHNIDAIRVLVREVAGFDPFPPTIYYFTEIPHRVEPLTVVLAAGGAIVTSLVFSLLPALRAARLDPVQTLHYE